MMMIIIITSTYAREAHWQRRPATGKDAMASQSLQDTEVALG